MKKIILVCLLAVTFLFVATAQNFDPNRRADPDAANWDIASLDTAADADDLTGIEKDVILETNKVRTDPKKFAQLYIQPRLQYYQRRNFSVPGQTTIVTNEGASAVRECINALNRAKSAGILYPEKGLNRAAKDHVTDQAKTGQVGHRGSDRSSPDARMKRYGRFEPPWTHAENIEYGSVTGRDIVIQLLVDDGVKNRGHRINIMSPDFTQTGVACGTHNKFRTSCTINYATGYISNTDQKEFFFIICKKKKTKKNCFV